MRCWAVRGDGFKRLQSFLSNHHHLCIVSLSVFILPRHIHHVLQITLDVMDGQFVHLIWSVLTNFNCLDRTLWKSSQLRLPAEVLRLIVQDSLPDPRYARRRLEYKAIRSFCLVCKAWRPICQRTLFEKVTLCRADHFDKLCSLKGTTASAALLTYICRIDFDYGPPYYKLGEVIPLLVNLSLPNLESLVISGKFQSSRYPTFPIHHSLRGYASRLHTIRFLCIYGFKFTHLAEFRRFLGIFGGLRRLEVNQLDLGTDRQGDCRPLYRTQNRSLRKIEGVIYDANNNVYQNILPIFWITDPPDLEELTEVTSDTISETVGETPCPVLTPDTARLLTSMYRILRKEYGHSEEWTCMDGKKPQCTFISIYLGH